MRLMRGRSEVIRLIPNKLPPDLRGVNAFPRYFGTAGARGSETAGPADRRTGGPSRPGRVSGARRERESRH
ncbi:hypothetical protein GCM10012280_53530 [Wenjunlia tyrosinilytica]|uniref:Uncharacterized protein n=1 Tax=Wenjunlia tyrosinilytica TaxID=1544741 RepID=A0A917ZVE8_9ACTN|nr:hypothetical protein GCM10012280_53530 [Wenjunlia tyrosinilytica]